MSPANRRTAAKEKLAAPPAAAPRPTASASTTVEASAVDMARDLAAIVEAHALSELVVETERLTLTIRRGGAVAAPAPHVVHHHPTPMPAPTVHAPPLSSPALAAPAAASKADDLHVVTSPFVGTYYASPSPDADPYVTEGKRVEKGQVLCIVEAMKLMNEIEADVSGTIAEVLVANGKTVEYGQPLFKISRA